MNAQREAVQPELVNKCRFCHCTPDAPCVFHGDDECGLLGALRDRCSAPGCLIAYAQEQKRLKREAEETRRAAVRPIRTAWIASIIADRKARKERRARRSKRKGAAA